MPLRHVRLTKLLDELQVQRRHLAHDRLGVVENRRVADDGNQADADGIAALRHERRGDG